MEMSLIFCYQVVQQVVVISGKVLKLNVIEKSLVSNLGLKVYYINQLQFSIVRRMALSYDQLYFCLPAGRFTEVWVIVILQVAGSQIQPLEFYPDALQVSIHG